MSEHGQNLGGSFVKKISRSRIAQWLLAMAVVAAAMPVPGYALTDEEIFRDFRFNLSNPGARSLGLGGAFIAVADDATASLANPAGLMLLARPEFFTEVRDIQTDDTGINETTTTRDFGGQRIQVGTLSSDTDARAVFSPSFFAYAYPFERFALGISRIEINKASNSTSNRFILDFDPNSVGGEIPFLGSGRIETDLSVWNLSGAFGITDTLSVGATIAVGVLNIQSTVTNTFVDDPNNPIFIDPAFTNVPPEITLYRTDIDDTDTDIAFNAGVHWKLHEKVSVGAVYRGGLQFEVDEMISQDQLFSPFFGFGLTDPNVLENPFGTSFNTPDSYGIGVAWTPLGALTLSLDWIHIEYEDLLKDFQPGVNVLNTIALDPNVFFAAVASEQRKDDFPFTIEDADEFHLGGEYVFTAGTVPIAARAGVYTDHNSRLYADFDDKKPFGDPFFSDNNSFPERDTETHVTVGTGAVVQGKFQIDAAADFSGIGNTFVLSTIFRF
jgi:long-subunit fatty acid transport protein